MIWKLEHLKTRKFKTLEIKKIYEFEFLFGSVAIFHISLPIARWLSKSVLVIDWALILFETYNRIRVTLHWSVSHTRYLASVFFFIFLHPYCYPFCLSTLHHAEICLLYFLNCILIFLFIFLHFSTKFSEKIPQRVSLFSDNENNFNIVSFFLCRNKVLIEQIIKEMVKLIAASHLKI